MRRGGKGKAEKRRKVKRINRGKEERRRERSRGIRTVCPEESLEQVDGDALQVGNDLLATALVPHLGEVLGRFEVPAPHNLMKKRNGADEGE